MYRSLLISFPGKSMVRDTNVFSLPAITLQPGGGRGDSHMKGAGQILVSFRVLYNGVLLRTVKVSFRAACKEI